jgi:hypothetical protein
LKNKRLRVIGVILIELFEVKTMEIMGLLSEQAQAIIARGIVDEFKALRELAEQSAGKGDYVTRQDLAKELGVSVPTLIKLELDGLKPIQFSDSRLIYYSRKNLDEVMRSHMI